MLRSIKKRLSRNDDPRGDGSFDTPPEYRHHGSQHSVPNSTSSVASTTSSVSRRSTGAKKHAANFAAAITNVSSTASASLKTSFNTIPPEPEVLTQGGHLAKFDACVEAADVLAASYGQENRVLPARIDEATGLSDCSVLVSPDGDLLLVPQGDHERLFDVRKRTTSSELSSPPGSKGESEKGRNSSLFSELMLNGKDDYEAAVFLGNDLQPEGDKSLNRFTAKGWSIPATNVALQQTERSLADFGHFCEEIVLLKKDSAAKTSLACDNLRRKQPSMGGQAPSGDFHANDWEIIDPRSTDFEVTPRRVGPVLMPGSTLNTAIVSLERYHSSTAESEAARWRAASLQRKGCLPALRKASTLFAERARNRQLALDEATRRARQMEDRLTGLKRLADEKWEAVFRAEDMVTQRVERIMQQRSREREKQRLDQLREAEANRVSDGEDSPINKTTSSEEIWDIVSSVARSMEDGSFEPMDLPSVELGGSNDAGGNETPKDAESAPETEISPKSGSSAPIASREQIELEIGLPHLRAAAMAADESVADAADSLMNLLTTLDTTRRSARVAAETCLVSACNAQASCIKSLIKLERASLEERLRELSALDEVVDNIDVRADLDKYIAEDRLERGGSSHLGDDDDGGTAAALAILSRHVDGSMGSDPLHRMSVETSTAGGASLEDDATSEELDAALEKIFERENKQFAADAPESEETTSTRNEFQKKTDLLCKIVSDTGPASRTKRSTICYKLNSKRSTQAEIETKVQFDSLCRLFSAILTGCNSEEGGVSNAKMCIMLAQTFYVNQDPLTPSSAGSGDDGDEEGSDRDMRMYVKSHLNDHPIWEKDDFWDQALSQQITESLTHSGVMANFEKNRQSSNSKERKKSEWTHVRKTKWYDLSHMERTEAASQVQAVVFAQLGALAHSMMELGCGLQRSCAFVRRMSVRHQLPSSQRTMLLQHLMVREDVDRNEIDQQDGENDEGDTNASSP